MLRIRPQSHPGLFKPGHPKKRGRKPGQPNRMTTLVREATLLGAQTHGEDGKGKNGLIGYMTFLARCEPRAMAMLLARILPLQITGPNNGPLQLITSSMTPQEAMQAYLNTVKVINAKVAGDVPLLTNGSGEHDSDDEC